MANNKIYLVYRPTGYAVCIGRRIGFGWSVYEDVKEDLETLYELIEKDVLDMDTDEDDFFLAMEDSNSPNVITKWKYESKKEFSWLSKIKEIKETENSRSKD